MPDAEPTGPSEAAPAAPRSRGRTVSGIVCLVLAALLTTPALLAHWGQRTLNDTERYVATVGPLVDSPEVQDAVAAKVTTAIERQVDVEALLNEAFSGLITDRPRLQLLVGPLASSINALIDQQVREFIASDAFEDLWITVNTRSQQAMLKLLRGEDAGAVSIQADQVVLDVSEVIEQVKLRLVDRGLTLLDRAPIPDTDRQIVLLEAPQLRELRTIYAFANPVARWLLLVVMGLYAAGFFLVRRRARMTVAIGVVVVANAVLMGLALSIGRQLFVNELAGTVFSRASSVFFTTLLVYLENGRKVGLGLGLTLVVAGWYASSSGSAHAVRGTVSGGLESVGRALADDRSESAGVWVAANAGWLRVVAGALGVAVVVWGNAMTPERLLWSLALVVVLLAVVQLLVGAGRKAVDEVTVS